MQLELVAARQRDEVPDTLLLVEHPHIFTLGRSRAAVANVVAPGDVPVLEIERGGDVPYHGPRHPGASPSVLSRPAPAQPPLPDPTPSGEVPPPLDHEHIRGPYYYH